MKPIKFRAWNKELNKMWKDGIYIALNGVLYDAVNGELDTLIDDVELMQYTGLKDSEVKEEYFGYLIREDDGTIRVIEDGSSAVLFKDVKTGNIKYFWELSFHTVIGNIYENKELLNDKESISL